MVRKTFNLSAVPLVLIIRVALLPVLIILPPVPIVVPAAVLVFTPKDAEAVVPALNVPNDGLAKVQLVTVTAATAFFTGKIKINNANKKCCSLIAKLRC